MNEDLDNLSVGVEAKILSLYDNVDQVDTELFFDDFALEGHSFKELFSERELNAQGGCKNIFKVKDNRAKRYVALAELRDDANEEMAECFFNEARITASLQHPNIVPVHYVGLNDEKLPFFTMKFLKDQSLAKVIRELNKKSEEYVSRYPLNILLDVFIKVCEAIAYAHSRGIIHLDLKPENIMIGDYGEVYVCDWGLAKNIDVDDMQKGALFKELDENCMRTDTIDGVIKGTPGFMAPEQINSLHGKKDEKSDIYALGALLYAILTLQVPFDGYSFEEMIKLTLKGELKTPVSLNGKIPESLNAVVLKAMQVNKADRYSSVDEIINEIKSYQSGFATDAEQAGFFKSFFLLLKRHRVVSLLLVVIFILSVGSFAILTNRERRLNKAVIQFKSEHKLRREQLVRSAPALLEQLQNNPSLMDYDWIHQQLDELIAANDNKLAKEVKTFLFLSHLDFVNALSVAETVEGSLGKELIDTVSRIKTLYFTDRREFGYMRGVIARKCLEVNHFKDYRSPFAKVFMGKVFAQLPSDTEKGFFVLNSLKVWGYHGHFQAENIVKTEKGQVTLDLSHLDITSLNGLEAFPITNLRLCHTSLIYYPWCGNKYVQQVDFSGAENIRTLRGLRYQPNLELVILPLHKKNSAIEEYLKESNIEYKIASE